HDVPVPRLEDEARAAEPLERHVSVNPLDAVTILYTSGTTGTPKGAVGSHLALVEQVHVALIDTFDLRPDDFVFGGLPFFHSFGQSSVLNTAFRRGAAILLLPRFEPAEALTLMERHGATVFTAVPTMYVGLLAAAAQDPARPCATPSRVARRCRWPCSSSSRRRSARPCTRATGSPRRHRPC